MMWRSLPTLRPSVLYVGGEKAELTCWGILEQAAKFTGTGTGGSGGMEAGRVKNVLIPKVFHTVVLKKVADTAAVLAPWILTELEGWKQDERRIEENWEGLPSHEKSRPSSKWYAQFFEADKRQVGRGIDIAKSRL
ncbi:hypothetical protein N7495_004895 [Penicillium taxi]|uniref:uncharacterized protein n=1 Tax=Penicillium taxi TaxID=168475 RepID=UPI0025454AE5|nr:uncharacterized protein N7495_004895 [Penicillium taxi]KAJ5900151.1 hypothetical protein N7495_004895 [Penicillium taxi]